MSASVAFDGASPGIRPPASAREPAGPVRLCHAGPHLAEAAPGRRARRSGRERFGEELIGRGEAFFTVAEEHVGTAVKCGPAGLRNQRGLAQAGLAQNVEERLESLASSDASSGGRDRRDPRLCGPRQPAGLAMPRSRRLGNGTLAAPGPGDSWCLSTVSASTTGSGASTRPGARSWKISSSRARPFRACRPAGHSSAVKLAAGPSPSWAVVCEEERLASARQSADPGGPAHGRAEIVAATHFGLAGVQARAHPELDAVGPQLRCQRTLPREARRATPHRSHERKPTACCRPRPETGADGRRARRCSPPRSRDAG